MTTSLVPQTDLTKNAGSDYSTEGNLPVMESQLMTIDMANAAFIMESLTNLYSDPYFSVAREYIANAIDSHIEAGNTNPVVVMSPSTWSPNLVIKDQGVGMSQDDVFRYGTYGSSDKRDNLEVVGNFGMGSKSALAISNSFTITAIKDGEYTMATIGRNDDGHGQVDIIITEPTTEPNGVTITIPITAGNIYIMQNKVGKVLTYLPGGTVELDGTVNTDIRDTLTEISDDVWIDGFSWQSRYISRTDVTIISGGFGYNVPFNTILEISESLDNSPVGTPDSIYIDVPTGSVDLTPSREQLRMTARTKTLIQQSVKAVVAECSEKYSKQLENISTYEELYELVETTGGHRSTTYVIDLCENLEIPKSDNMVATCYRNGEGVISPRNTSQLNYTLARDLAHSKAIILDNDKNYSDNSLTARVKSYLSKVSEEYTERTPVLELNPSFKDDPSNTKDNLYRYIDRTAVRMKASEIYAAVNEYNKANRVPSNNTGYSTGRGDEAEIESVFIDPEDVTKTRTHYPEAGGMKKFYEDMVEDSGTIQYILNNPKNSGNRIDPQDIKTIHSIRKILDENYEAPNVVLIYGGTRKSKYFSQRGMHTVSVSDFIAGHKDALLSENTLKGLGSTSKYFNSRERSFRLNRSIYEIKTSHPGTSAKVDEIDDLLFPTAPREAATFAGLVGSYHEVAHLIGSLVRWVGPSDAVNELREDIRQDRMSYGYGEGANSLITSRLLDSATTLLTHGHADEGYGMLDMIVNLLTKEED